MIGLYGNRMARLMTRWYIGEGVGELVERKSGGRGSGWGTGWGVYII